MVKKLLIFVLLSTSAFAADPPPAPRCLQLKICVAAYWNPWDPTYHLGPYDPYMLGWAANRFGMIFSSTASATTVDPIKAINPNAKFVGYSVYGAQTVADSIPIRNFVDSINAIAPGTLTYDSIVLTTGPLVGDSVMTHERLATTGAYVDIKTPGGGYWIQQQEWDNSAANRRLVLDPRSPWTGRYLARKWRAYCISNKLNGVMIDEETRYTGLYPASGPTFPNIDPKSPDDSTGAVVTNPQFTYGWNHFTKPFNFPIKGHPYIGPCGTNMAQYAGGSSMGDSLKAWRTVWAAAAANSMAAAGLYTIPNGSFWGISYNQSWCGWVAEGKEAATNWRGAVFSEVNYQRPSAANLCMLGMERMAYELRDIPGTFIQGWVGVGWWDSCVGSDGYAPGLNRSKGLFLGVVLNGTFPETNGSSTWWFPKAWSTYHDVYHGPCPGSYGCNQNQGAGCTKYFDASYDSTLIWSDAWGKFFGTPMATRDSSQTGTDPSGQSFKIHKSAFLRPGFTNDTLTFCALRFGLNQGHDIQKYGPTTAVSVTLPGGPLKTWYELIENTQSNGNGLPQSYWGPATSGGTTFTLRNAEARVFSSDKSLADAGPTYSGSLTIGDATAMEGATLSFPVTLSSTQATNVTFNYVTGAGTATAGTTCATSGADYVNQTGTATIIAGQLSTTVTVPTCDDNVPDGTESMIVTISNPPSYINITDAVGAGTITNGDTIISISGNSANEGSPLNFTVSITTPSGGTLSIPINFLFTTTDVTAMSPADYIGSTSAPYTLVPSSLSRLLAVTTNTDALVEATETFTGTISNPDHGILGTASATGAIVDVTAPPTPAGKHYHHWRKP